MQQIGVAFTAQASHILENMQLDLPAKQIISRLALQKAQDVSQHYSQGLVIGADTIVVCRGLIMGKPANQKDAAMMLRTLSGVEHQVMTAVAIVDAGGERSNWQGTVETKVYFRTLSEQDIADYLETGESMDKAGAYGIQGFGALLVERIEGCYFNIVGLPLQKVAEGLKTMGVDLYRYGNHKVYD